MNKHSKRLLANILFISIAAGAISCGSSKNAVDTSSINNTNSTSVTEETTLSPDESRRLVDDELPERNFEGKEFTILSNESFIDDIYTESDNGEVINDAIFKRNQTVSERFNTDIQVNLQDNIPDFINRTVMAGDNAFNLVTHHAIEMGTIIMNDLFINWYDVPYIDFSKPWWSPSTVNDLTYGNDKALLAVGDLSLSSLSKTYCYFYDKQGALDYKVENLYQVVNDGKWTIDYVRNLVKDMYQDLNGNSELDGDDYYGMTQQMFSAAEAYLWAFGGKVMQRNASGIPELVYNGEKTAAIYEKLYQLCYESDGVCVNRNFDPSTTPFGELTPHFYGALSFQKNLTFMTSGTLDMTIDFFRDKSTEYGILPYPKYDESQKDYYTMVDGGFAALAIPKSISDEDLEFTGIITEALNAESFKTVYPAYYETALKTKYTYDDESVKMLDMIVNSRVFDFGFVYDAWKGLSFYYERLLYTEKSKDFASYYAKNSAAAIQYYDELLEYFEKME